MYRPRRTVHLPAPLYDMEEIIPVSPVPHGLLRVQCFGCDMSSLGSMNISAQL
jgi:hypothetical protein